MDLWKWIVGAIILVFIVIFLWYKYGRCGSSNDEYPKASEIPTDPGPPAAQGSYAELP